MIGSSPFGSRLYHTRREVEQVGFGIGDMNSLGAQPLFEKIFAAAQADIDLPANVRVVGRQLLYGERKREDVSIKLKSHFVD